MTLEIFGNLQLGISMNDPMNLNGGEMDLREWLDMKLLPIACDSFGNYIVISLSDKNNGRIYFCGHESGSDDV